MTEGPERGAEAFFREQRNAFDHTLATQGTEAALKKSVDVEITNNTGNLIPVGAQD